jgi:hypothetical protein
MRRPKPLLTPYANRNRSISDLATKSDIADVRQEIADSKAEMIKWFVGVAFAEVAMILAVLKLFPGGHP